jgi:hypothetical protein
MTIARLEPPANAQRGSGSGRGRTRASRRSCVIRLPRSLTRRHHAGNDMVAEQSDDRDSFRLLAPVCGRSRPGVADTSPGTRGSSAPRARTTRTSPPPLCRRMSGRGVSVAGFQVGGQRVERPLIRVMSADYGQLRSVLFRCHIARPCQQHGSTASRGGDTVGTPSPAATLDRVCVSRAPSAKAEVWSAHLEQCPRTSSMSTFMMRPAISKKPASTMLFLCLPSDVCGHGDLGRRGTRRADGPLAGVEHPADRS